ncbi:MAG: hypothetical protein ACI9BD_000036 [Candidatus Marinamargulisbacteria bacterium]|jgi:hypothetical protein
MKTFIIPTVAIAISLTGLGCSKSIHENAANPIYQVDLTKNILAQQLGPRLASADSKEAMLDAIETFRTYAIGRLKTTQKSDSSPSEKTTVISLLKQYNLAPLAQMDWAARKPPYPYAITLDQFVTQLNRTLSDYGVESSKPEIQTLQTYLRSYLPKLANTEEPKKIYPFESLILTWGFLTGDLGEAEEQSIQVSTQALQNLKKPKLGYRAQDCLTAAVVAIAAVIFVDAATDPFIPDFRPVEWIVFDLLGLKKGRGATPDPSEPDSELLTNSDLDNNGIQDEYYGFEDFALALKALSPYLEFDSRPGPGVQVAVELPRFPANESYARGYDPEDITYTVATDAEFNKMKEAVENIGIRPHAGRHFSQSWWASVREDIQKGDIFFFRRTDPIGKAVSLISSWTHVALSYSPENDQVLESLPQHNMGVILNNSPTPWKPAVSFSAKRIKETVMTRIEISNAVDYAYLRWVDKTPYFPQIVKQAPTNALNHLLFFIKHLADKSEDSMICSNFVWHTYNSAGIDLDSNHATLRTSPLFNMTNPLSRYGLGIESLINLVSESASRDDGTQVSAFIGALPDDLYYSKYLSADLPMAFGLENLPKAPHSGQTYDYNPVNYFSEDGRKLISGQHIETDQTQIDTAFELRATTISETGGLHLYARDTIDLKAGTTIEPGSQCDFSIQN